MFPIRDHNPSRRTPYVTVGLILANVAIFLMSWQAIADQAIVFRLYDAYALVPAKITSGFGWQGFVTSAFLHAELLHLAGNMLFCGYSATISKTRWAICCLRYSTCSVRLWPGLRRLRPIRFREFP